MRIRWVDIIEFPTDWLMRFSIPHGGAQLPAAQEALALVSKSMGESIEGLAPRWAAQAAVDAVRTLASDVGVPLSLSELGIPRADIPMLVEGALKVTETGREQPKKSGPEEAEAIYEAAFSC